MKEREGPDETTGGEKSQEISESKLPYFLTIHKNNRRKSSVKEAAFLNPATF